MSQFLYFIPGIPRSNVPRAEVASTFAAVALWDLLRSDKTWAGDAYVANPLTQDGPGGQTGTIFACLPGGMAIEGFSVDYRPAEQTWIPCGTAWLGWYTNNPPTESSLRRQATVTGYGVVLNDDCEWHAPTVRCFPEGSRITLPQAIGRGPDGKRTTITKPHYQRFQDLTAKLWDFRFVKEGLTIGEACDAAAQLLSLNYRLGPCEADALGLFEVVQNIGQEANWMGIIEAAYDWPIVAELLHAEELKKKESVPKP